MITVSAFHWVPSFAQGQVRDLRVRWALEEAGLPYRSRLLEQGDQDSPEYRAMQPFGQVPIFEEDGNVLFESGAIVLYIGERSETLLPNDPQARARATQWLIAALNSIENFDTGGIIGVPITIKGNSIPVGRIYRADMKAQKMVAASDWIVLK